jgi:hypothetical protein
MKDHLVLAKNVHGLWMQQILRTVLYYNNFNITLHTDVLIATGIIHLPFTIDKLYNNAVYVFKYWYSLKTAVGSSQNM